MSSFEGSDSKLTQSDANRTMDPYCCDLRNIDQKIAWFSQRLATLRMERMMCQMSLGTMKIQADPGYLENIYVGHLCKLHAERASNIEAAASMDTK